jgi:hypothetical protein
MPENLDLKLHIVGKVGHAASQVNDFVKTFR